MTLAYPSTSETADWTCELFGGSQRPFSADHDTTHSQLEPKAAIITSYTPLSPASPANSAPAYPKKRRRLPRLPLLLRPTTYPFSRPVSLAIIVTLPVSLPLALLYLIGRFVLQSHSSRRRIKDMRNVMGGGREGMLERVGVKLREVAEEVGGADNPEYAAGLESLETPTPNDSEAEEEQRTLKTHPAFQALASYGGTDTPPLSRPIPPTATSSSPVPTDPILSPAQLTMIANLNSIPQMRKHLVYLPESRNSHGAVVARDADRFPQHRPGKKIVDRWAEEFRL